MPYSLIPKSLFSHPIRTILTLASLVVAVFLICMLRTIVVSLDAGVRAAAHNRLVVQSAVSLFVSLPRSYQAKIGAVPGVDDIEKWQWFGGVYQDPSNFFAQFGVDAKTLFDVYPEIRIADGSKADFIAQRSACLIGEDLAKRFGFKVGDTIPLIGTIFRRTDGTPWEFTVAAIYHSTSSGIDNGSMFFHYDYLSESLDAGAAQGPTGVGVYVAKIADGARPEDVMSRIDALFANGPQRVQTTTEAEFQRQFVTMIGSVPTFLTSIGGGVLFAILLAALNTMLMAARERTRDVGILKAMGFTNRSVAVMLLLESVTLCGVGGILGVGLSLGVVPILRATVGRFFPGLVITPGTIAFAILLSLLVGLLAGIVPALRARRLDPVEALREVV